MQVTNVLQLEPVSRREQAITAQNPVTSEMGDISTVSPPRTATATVYSVFFRRIVWCPSGGALPETVCGSKPFLPTLMVYFKLRLWPMCMMTNPPVVLVRICSVFTRRDAPLDRTIHFKGDFGILDGRTVFIRYYASDAKRVVVTPCLTDWGRHRTRKYKQHQQLASTDTPQVVHTRQFRP